jgi:acyl-CoA thioesterase-2
MDEWLLCVMESPNAYKAKGLNYGKIYTVEGKLVASVIREGLIRHHAKKWC